MNVFMGLIKFLVLLGKIGRVSYKGPLLGAWFVALATLLGSWTFEFPYLIPIVVFGVTFPWWFFTTDFLYSKLTEKLIKLKFENPKIGVITSQKIGSEEMNDLIRSSVFLPDIWTNHLRESFKTEQIEYNDIDTDFPMVINPFGELYLEEDLPNLKTFKQIKDYIENGGVFVNTGGLAFFYMWNPETRKEGLTGPLMETYILDKNVLQPIVLPDDSSLINTWLYTNFGIRTSLGDERLLKARSANSFENVVKKETEVLEFRSAIRCESKDAKLIPILIAEYKNPHGRMHECYPVAAIKYGIGYLILIGMRLKEKKDLHIVIDAIKEVCNKLSKEGTLDFNRLN